MERRHRMALLAAAVVLLAAIVALAGRSSSLTPVAAASAGTSAFEALPTGVTDHVDRAVLPGVRIPSIRPADHRFDPPNLPWLLAVGSSAVALLVASGARWNLGPATVRVGRGRAERTPRGRGPPPQA